MAVIISCAILVIAIFSLKNIISLYFANFRITFTFVPGAQAVSFCAHYAREMHLYRSRLRDYYLMTADIFLTTVLLSFAVMGLWICFNWQGMIFEPLAYYVEQICFLYGIPYYVLKPLWSCPTCMSSFWGLVYYALLGHSYLSGRMMLVIIPAVAFINTLFCILLNKTTDEGC